MNRKKNVLIRGYEGDKNRKHCNFVHEFVHLPFFFHACPRQIKLCFFQQKNIHALDRCVFYEKKRYISHSPKIIYPKPEPTKQVLQKVLWPKHLNWRKPWLQSNTWNGFIAISSFGVTTISDWNVSKLADITKLLLHFSTKTWNTILKCWIKIYTWSWFESRLVSKEVFRLNCFWSSLEFRYMFYLLEMIGGWSFFLLSPKFDFIVVPDNSVFENLEFTNVVFWHPRIPE